MNKLRNTGDECALCDSSFKEREHRHVVRTFIKMKEQEKGEVTLVQGFVHCSCVTRLSSRQVPSPFEDEQGHNTLKDSAPVPFTPQIDWGAIEKMQRFAELTKDTPTARKVKTKLAPSTTTTTQEAKKW